MARNAVVSARGPEHPRPVTQPTRSRRVRTVGRRSRSVAARELGATFIHIDPTDDGTVEAAVARVRNEYGHLDVLINNAGTAAPRVGAEGLTADAAMEGFAVNVFGPIASVPSVTVCVPRWSLKSV